MMSDQTTKLNRRSVLGGSLAFGAGIAVIGRASAQAKVTWRVQSHWPKASSSFTEGLGVVATEIEKRTDGAFKLETFGDGEFAKGAEIYNLVRRGVVEMGTLAPAYLQNESQVAGLAYGIPGTLKQYWELSHLVKNLGIEDMLNEDLNKAGVLYRTEKAYPTELVVKKDITSVEDFQGLKIRSAGTMLDYLAAAGAAPTYIAGAELYQALSSGVVDGAHWGAAIGAQSMSLWEVAKFHVRPPLGITTDGYIVNIAAVEKLPDDIRKAFLALLEERFWRRTAEYQHKEEIALSKGRNEQGVKLITFPDALQKKLTEASKAVLEKEAARGDKGAEGVKRLNALMKDLGYV
jgi:TRAP-type C4-dicarboxylate transport system substrate-binding protein